MFYMHYTHSICKILEYFEEQRTRNITRRNIYIKVLQYIADFLQLSNVFKESQTFLRKFTFDEKSTKALSNGKITNYLRSAFK